MPLFKRISPDNARDMMLGEPYALVDIRDAASFQTGRITGAVHLNHDNVDEFLKDGNHEQALIVYCYHGNSSQSAAQYLAEQGFSKVFSLDGGYETWRHKFPDLVEFN